MQQVTSFHSRPAKHPDCSCPWSQRGLLSRDDLQRCLGCLLATTSVCKRDGVFEMCSWHRFQGTGGTRESCRAWRYRASVSPRLDLNSKDGAGPCNGSFFKRWPPLRQSGNLQTRHAPPYSRHFIRHLPCVVKLMLGAVADWKHEPKFALSESVRLHTREEEQ